MEEQIEKRVGDDEQESTRINLGMKWFKFLIYFGLWAGAILNFVTGVRMMTGNIYLSEGVNADLVYKTFPNLQSVDVLFGLLFCAFAIFQIVTRFYLAGFKKIAPAMLSVVYIANGVFNFVYNSIVASIISSNLGGQTIVTILVAIVMVIVNNYYFGNRKNLFVK